VVGRREYNNVIRKIRNPRKEMILMQEDQLTQLFISELNSRNVSHKLLSEDLIEVTLSGDKLDISLHNLRANFNRDLDVDLVREFVDSIIYNNYEPAFLDIKSTIRFMLVPIEALKDTDGIINKQLTEELAMVLTYSFNDERLIRWITVSDISEWDITVEELLSLADKNMNQLLDEVKIEISEVRGINLAMLSSDKEAFKASIILASNFNEMINEYIELPVFAVTPARDFIFIFSCNDDELINLLGKVVLREFEESAYSLTTEILKIDGNGISAFGKYGY
jgi:hypothetical protein